MRLATTLVLPLLVAVASAMNLPDGPGKVETERLCQGCHDLAKSFSVRQDRNGWANTLTKMVGLGLKATDQELLTLVDYLSRHFPAEELPPVNVNKARAIQLESRLSLKRSEAAAILRHRKEHGDFRTLADLLSVPGIDVAKIEARKDRLVFE